jgi:hypothetical protein
VTHAGGRGEDDTEGIKSVRVAVRAISFSTHHSGDAGAVANVGFVGIGPVRNELSASDIAGLRAWFARDNRTNLTTVRGLALLAAFLVLVIATIANGDAFSFAALVSIVALAFIGAACPSKLADKPMESSRRRSRRLSRSMTTASSSGR